MLNVPNLWYNLKNGVLMLLHLFAIAFIRFLYLILILKYILVKLLICIHIYYYIC